MAEHGIDVIDEFGDLRQQLQYQERTAAGRSPYGKSGVGNFATLATVWASIRTLNGREAANADRLKITSTHVVRTRYFPGASANGRFLFGARAFNIDSVVNVNELNVVYDFMTTEVANPPE